MSLLQKPLIFILLIGILIRLILSAVTFHPDIGHFDLAGYVLGKGNFLNFYDYPNVVFNYPPAVYFSVGALDWLLTRWTDVDFHNNFLFDFKDTLGDFRLNLHLILLKIPYLPFDFVTALLLYKLFTVRRQKILAFTLWIFNPWVLYSTYMMGQFDVIPTAFVMMALYILNKEADLNKRVFLSAFLLGIGASFKIYPALFLLPLAFILPTWSKRIQAVFLGILVYVATILPFISSQGYRSAALAASQIFKSLYAQISVSGGEGIILFLAFTGFVYFIYLYQTGKAENLWQRFFIILLLFFVFTHYHPQWFLWLTPFLIIELICTNFKHYFLLLIIATSFIGSVFLFEQSLSIGLFAPLNFNLYNGPTLWKLLNIQLDVNFSRSLFQSLFVCAAGYLIYTYFPRKSG